MNQPSLYFVFPLAKLQLDRAKIREMIAVMKVLEQKDPATHAYEVLDGRYTRLRRELRQEFEQAFGNPGLRSGSMVVRGQGDTFVPVDSWNRFLPTILADLDRQFCHQIRVCCGSFNQWQAGGNWSKIENVVRGILKSDACEDYWELCTGRKETSQEAAIIDGVLVENGLPKREGPGPHGHLPIQTAVFPWRLSARCGNISPRPEIESSPVCSVNSLSRRTASRMRSFRSWWPWYFARNDRE